MEYDYSENLRYSEWQKSSLAPEKIHSKWKEENGRIYRLSVSACGGLKVTKTIVFLKDIQKADQDISGAANALFDMAIKGPS